VAAELKWQLELDTVLVSGDRGEFTVWLGDRKVAEKRGDTFPSPAAVVEAVREALADRAE